jgi:hypothetical protein
LIRIKSPAQANLHLTLSAFGIVTILNGKQPWRIAGHDC